MDAYIKIVDGTDNTEVRYENWAGAGVTRKVKQESGGFATD
jgi:hypothetical protein